MYTVVQVSSHGNEMRQFFDKHCKELEKMAAVVTHGYQEQVGIVLRACILQCCFNSWWCCRKRKWQPNKKR